MIRSKHNQTSAARRGGVPLALPLFLAAGAALLGVRELERRAEGQGFGWIEPANLRLGDLPTWADPRWGEELDELLYSSRVIRGDDEVGLEELRAAIESLSFVRSVPSLEVVWPKSLAIELHLRRPVACVPVGDDYQLVCDEGVLLSGLWPVPPRLGSLWLPVIGPLSDGYELFDGARSGDYLAEPEHLDALDVALSLAEHLEPDEFDALGRVVIDATRARDASVDEPGVSLELEDFRTVLFGRPPGWDEPGELDAARKWAALSAALALIEEDEALVWDLVDVRWDRPEIAFRHSVRERGSLVPTAVPSATPAAPKTSGSASPNSISSPNSIGSIGSLRPRSHQPRVR